MKTLKQHQLKENHFTAMKKQLLALGKAKGIGRICGDSAFSRIPTAASFIVETQPYNMFLEKLGLKLRLPMEYKYKKTEYDKLNKYMQFILRRIRKQVSNKKFNKAWNIAFLNIKYSLSFRLSAFNYVLAGWYFDTPVSEISKLLKKVNVLIKRKAYNLKYKRVYIPKANGKLRPLGVPAKEWRVYLHLINGFLIEILKGEISPNQHAYLPNKGVMTAWRDILESAKEYDYIYETDLKNFFPSVSVHRVIEIMKNKYQVPTEFADWLLNLSKSIPSFPKEKLMDESKFDVSQLTNSKKGWSAPQNREIYSKHAGTIENFTKMMSGMFPVKQRKKLLHPADREEILLMEQLTKKKVSPEPNKLGSWFVSKERQLKIKNVGIIPGGFPQGMPCSAFLSIFVLGDYFEQAWCNIERKVIGYADDFVFMFKQPCKPRDFPEYGITHAEDKCGWIKYNGNWTKKGLKFVGLRYFGHVDKIMSETRSGVKAQINETIGKIYSNEQALTVLANVQNINQIETLAKLIDTDFLSHPNGKVEILDKDKKISEEFYQLLSKKESKDIAWNIYTSDEEGLIKIAKRNIFGFIMSCMNIDSWDNDKSYEYNLKGIRNLIGRLNPKALLKQVPINTDSSWAISYLASVGKASMRNKWNVHKMHSVITLNYQKILKTQSIDAASISELREYFRKKRIKKAGFSSSFSWHLKDSLK